MTRQRLRVRRIERVALVDKGDNPTAHVVIHKRAPGQEDAAPAAAPPGDAAGLIRRVLAAIGKRLGWADDEVKKAYDEAATFAEVREERDLNRVTGEVWSMTSDLADAVGRTLIDDDEPEKAQVVQQSLAQFVTAFNAALPQWLAGETVEKAGRKISRARLERLKQARDAISALIAETEPSAGGDDMPEKTEKRLDVSALPEEHRAAVTAEIDRLEKALAEAKRSAGSGGAEGEPATDIEKLQARIEKLEKAGDTETAVLLKATLEQAQKAAERAEAAETLAKQEREKRQLAEFTKRAETEFAHLPGTAAEKAERMRKLVEKLGEEDAEKEFAAWNSADEQLRAGTLYAEIGRGGEADADSAYAKAVSRAKELVAKSEGITLAQAIDKVLESDPELQRAYLEEVR